MVNCAWWFNPRLAAPREAAAAGLCKTPRRVEADGLDAPASEVFGSARRRARREEALDFSDYGALDFSDYGDDGGLDGTRRGGRVPPFGRPRAASFTCLAVLDDAAGIGAALGRPRSAGLDAEAALAEASLDDSFYGSRAVSAERRSSSYHRRFPVSASLPSIAHEEGLGATRRPRCVRFATPLVARVEFFEPARASEKASTWFSPGQQKRAKFPTSKAPISAVYHSFRLIFGRAIISRSALEAWVLFPKRARAEHSR